MGVCSFHGWTFQKTCEELSTNKYGPSPHVGASSGLKIFSEKHRKLWTTLLIVVLFGACMVIGDGVHTPAISGEWFFFYPVVYVQVWVIYKFLISNRNIFVICKLLLHRKYARTHRRKFSRSFTWLDNSLVFGLKQNL